MNDKTLFDAYRQLRDRMSAIETGRVDTRGIATATDYYALLWQRRKRQALRIEYRMKGVKVCYSCLGQNRHWSDCKRNNSKFLEN